MSVLVGKEAPAFKAKCVEKNDCKDITLQDYHGKYVVLFFYPLDFTFVCPTELHAFQERLDDFKANNCVVLGCSVDSHFSHMAWLNTPKDRGGGLQASRTASSPTSGAILQRPTTSYMMMAWRIAAFSSSIKKESCAIKS